MLPSWNLDLANLLLLLSVIFAFFWYSLIFIRSTKAATRLPPGPPGLPVVGNLPFLDPALHSYFATLARTYGPIFKLRLGAKLAIVITSPSTARQILKDHDITFANRDVPVAGVIATYGCSDVAWTPYGPEWRMLRKLVVSKMLSNATLDSLYELRRREMRQTVGYFYSRIGSPVAVGDQMFLTVLNVMTNMLWGGSVKPEDRDRLGAEFRRMVSEMTELLGLPNVSDFFPGLARFDLQGVAKKMRAVAKEIDDIIEKTIDQRLKTEEDSRRESNDFLQFLLESKDEGSGNMPLTMNHIKALLMDMVVGGTDTSSNLVEFAMAELLNKPEIIAKAQQELDSVVGKDKIVEEAHIRKLPYLQALMKESLRLHPPLPLLVPHCPSETCTVGGYTVPKGTRVFVNAWAIHRDPSIWENPLEYNPDRFMTVKMDSYGSADFNYIPFGSGRRTCAGIAMAERTVLYSLATLLHSFDWKLPQGGDKVDTSEKFGIVLKLKTPLVAVPAPRLSHPALYE